MALPLNGVASTNSGTTYTGQWASGYIAPNGAAILVTVTYGIKGVREDSVTQTAQDGQSLNFTAPESGAIIAVAFQSAVTGNPATVYGYFGEADAVAVVASNSGSTAAVSAINGVTGEVSAAGAVTWGTGYTVTKGGAGNYTINFTPALAAQPIVVATSRNAIGPCVVGPISAAGFTIVWQANGGAAGDTIFDFIAVIPQ